jgi:hypothetical protein
LNQSRGLYCSKKVEVQVIFSEKIVFENIINESIIEKTYSSENLPYPLFALSPSWMALPSRKPGQASPRKGSCPGGRPYGLEAKRGVFFVKHACPALGRDRGR